jgi:hypothetical protein
MAEAVMTMTVDVSTLQGAIPRITAFGSRTIQEQCVTSVVFIALRAQKLTPAATVGRIDSDLEVEVSPVLSTRGKRKGLPLKSGKKTVQAKPGVRVPVGVLIIMARTNPNSRYSRETGNRWPILGMPSGPGSGRARQHFIAAHLQRMTMGRHSSTHFLQTGWTPAIRAGLSSEFYRYNSAFGSRRDARLTPNSMNRITPDQLGTMIIELTGDSVVVTATNDVGEPVGKSNTTLAEKHRQALIEYGTPALQQAVSEEAATIIAEIERRLALGWPVKFPELL